jgi:hypothetical protein
MSSSTIAKALDDLQTLAAQPPADKVVKRQLYDATRKLALAVEDPYDTIYRVVYSVRHHRPHHIHSHIYGQ